MKIDIILENKIEMKVARYFRNLSALGLFLFIGTITYAQPFIRYVCLTDDITTLVYDDIVAQKSSKSCDKSTRLRIVDFSGPADLAKVYVTRLDKPNDYWKGNSSNDGHRAQIDILWTPGKTGVISFKVQYKAKRYNWGFGCDFTDWRDMYTYEVHRVNGVSPQGVIDGEKKKGAPTSTSKTTFELSYLPKAPEFLRRQGCQISGNEVSKCGLIAKYLKYTNGKDSDQNGVVDTTVVSITRENDTYKPTPVAYEATGINTFFVRTQVYAEINGRCGQWYDIPDTRLEVHSSCYKDDYSNVKLSVSGDGAVDNLDGSFNIDTDKNYTLNASNILDFDSHYNWDFEDFGNHVVVNSDGSFKVLEKGSYRINVIPDDEDCVFPLALPVLVDIHDIVKQNNCAITLPDDFFSEYGKENVIFEHFTAYVKSSHSIILKPGLTLEAGAEAFLEVPVREATKDSLHNFIESVSYDEYGRVLTEGRVYLDDRGNVVQSQYRNLSDDLILAKETLYDRRGRNAVNTLPAPIMKSVVENCISNGNPPNIAKSAFAFKSDFVTTNGLSYSDANFDTEGNVQPDPVDDDVEGSLGKYYSQQNVMAESDFKESYAPATRYPYSMTLFKNDGSGEIYSVTKPGEKYQAGSGHVSSISKTKVDPDDAILLKYLSIRSREFQLPSTYALGQFLKSAFVDEHGKKVVTYFDKSGEDIINALYGDCLTGTCENPVSLSYKFYDDVRHLLATVSPNGVDQYQVFGNGESNFTDIDKIRYYYNGRGLVAAIEEKISGTGSGISRTEFVYRADGKIRFSQNELQRGISPRRFSFINYDRSGRIIQSGEYVGNSNGIDFNSTEMITILEDVAVDGGLDFADGAVKKDAVQSIYDVEHNGLPQGRKQRFTGGKISSSKTDFGQQWFSYNEKGQIEWFINELSLMGKSPTMKTFDYRYGPTGQIQDFVYQANQPDQFSHHYEYDRDGRMAQVFISRILPDYNRLGELTNKSEFELCGTYSYYLHGPLKRIELGDSLQGIDYVYNADGSLKGINHADPTLDPGRDGIISNKFPKDAFGETLDYYDGDHLGNYNNAQLVGLDSVLEQFTGSPRAIRWHSPVESNRTFGYTFAYDEKDQFLTANWATVNDSIFVPAPLNPYNESTEGYDQNGNITSLFRNSGTSIVSNSNLQSASFSYHYKATGLNTSLKSNLLMNITEGETSVRSYEYNALGKMVKERIGNVDRFIQYDVNGLVTGIYANQSLDQPLFSFTYDGNGNRISKSSHDANGEVYERWWYVRDATGRIISIYFEEPFTDEGPLQAEVPIYGAERLGLYKVDGSTGLKLFEVRDHLTNVRAVIGESFSKEILATMESELRSEEEQDGFVNINSAGLEYVNHTSEIVEVDGEERIVDLPNEVCRLNNLPNGIPQNTSPIGVGLYRRVHPGDVIEAEVFVKYANFDADNVNIVPGIANFLKQSFGDVTAIDGASIFNSLDDPSFGIGVWSKLDDQQPRLFLNYLLFDANGKLLAFDFDQVSSQAEILEGSELAPHERLSLESIKIEREGFIYIYVSNESNQNLEAYFDDLKIHHAYSNIVAGGDYYPYGLPIPDRTIDREDFRFGFQGGFSERDKETGWNSFKLRNYDPVIGRWLSDDPKRAGFSPYAGFDNNPIRMVDPDGGDPDDWIINKKTGIYSYDRFATDECNTPQGYRYVGPLVQDVYADFDHRMPWYDFSDVKDYMDYSGWPGQWTVPMPNGWERFKNDYEAMPVTDPNKYIFKFGYTVIEDFYIAFGQKGHIRFDLAGHGVDQRDFVKQGTNIMMLALPVPKAQALNAVQFSKLGKFLHVNKLLYKDPMIRGGANRVFNYFWKKTPKKIIKTTKNLEPNSPLMTAEESN